MTGTLDNSERECPNDDISSYHFSLKITYITASKHGSISKIFYVSITYYSGYADALNPLRKMDLEALFLLVPAAESDHISQNFSIGRSSEKAD